MPMSADIDARRVRPILAIILAIGPLNHAVPDFIKRLIFCFGPRLPFDRPYRVINADPICEFFSETCGVKRRAGQ